MSDLSFKLLRTYSLMLLLGLESIMIEEYDLKFEVRSLVFYLIRLIAIEVGFARNEDEKYSLLIFCFEIHSKENAGIGEQESTLIVLID
jgi:hypothetical protein